MVVAVDDGFEQHDAARYLRGEIRAVALDSLSDRQTKESNYELYRRTRRNALALWCEIVGMQAPTAARDSGASASDIIWPESGGGGAPCLLWCSGSWHCATACWCVGPEKKAVKVDFVGYDKEDAVIVNFQDPRLRRAVLDPRCGRDQPNHQVLKGVFPKKGDHVRVHIIDAAEASLFLQEGRFLTGVVVRLKAVHDSSLVEVVGLGGVEAFLVPNTRMEIVAAEDSARVIDIFELERNQVLRQLDIATSQTIAIEVVSGLGKVVDDHTSVSLWALGDQMVIRVWQQKGEFMLETSVSALAALEAIDMKGSALTVLGESERFWLLDRVRDRLRVSEGLLTMEMKHDAREGQQRPVPLDQAPGGHNRSVAGALLHRGNRSLEGVSVETTVMRGENGRLLLRSRTLPPEPERAEDIILQPEDWAPLGFPSLRWLDACRKHHLGEQLLHSVCARDGSLALRIDGRILRYGSFFAIHSAKGTRPKTGWHPQKLHSSGRTEAPPDPNPRQNYELPCPSGAPVGLCSCGVLLRVGVSLPLISTDNRKVFNSDNNTDPDRPLPSRGRWLVVVKAIGSELNLSLFRPSREAWRTTMLGGGGKGASEGAGRRGLGGIQTPGSMRRSFSLLMTWADWEQLGYGPLRWMSHAQKMLLARLSLSWVSLKAMSTSLNFGSSESPLETVLQVRPMLVSVERTVETPGDMSSAGGSSRNVGGMVSTATNSSGSNSAGAMPGISDETPRRYRVAVRDEGRVFRVELEAEMNHQKVNAELQDKEGGAQCGLLEQTFGKEAWRETGLGELLWMDRTWRQYLADRLSKQVAIAPRRADNGDGKTQDADDAQASLVIISDLPLLYWSGTVAIARLGSHSHGVFVTISDAGRRLLIEATDFEGGPMLASSTVSLEDWTAATGIHTLGPPQDDAFKKILQDRLAGFLGAGFRSRTNRLVAKREASEMQPRRRGRWRGTLMELSGMEIGRDELEHEHDNDSGSEAGGDVGTTTRPRTPLPPVSSSFSSTSAQKRTLRLEMLMRMVDDYHTKHGRRGAPGNSTPSSPDAAGGGNVENRPNRREVIERGSISGSGTALPPITPLTSPGPAITANQPTGHSGGRSETKAVVELKSHICLCCGVEGGKGHGRRCGHTFRRCGFCRAEEVRNVLFGAERGRRAVLHAGRRLDTPVLPVDAREESDGLDQEDEYDWITDTEEDDLKFKCDACGTVIEDTSDRFHCDTCSDYDLCQACFLTNRTGGGHESGGETGTGLGHLARHQFTRLMGETTPPFRGS